MLRIVNFVINYIFRFRPFEATIFVTTKCNLKCKHCFCRINRKSSNQLSLDEFKNASKSFPLTERLIFTGGEPFLRRDLSDIINLFYKSSKPKYITIPTNAFFAKIICSNVARIAKNCSKAFINISLSVDDLGKRRDEFVGVPGSFENLQMTALKLNNLKNKYSNIGITSITTQTKSNEVLLKEIFSYSMDKLKVDNIGFAVARGINNNLSEINANIYKKRSLELFNFNKKQIKKACSIIPLYRLYLNIRKLVYDKTYSILTKDDAKMKCYAGNLRFVLRENGDVYPCEILMDQGDKFLIGNLRDYDMNFRRLWSSKRRRDVIDQIKMRKCACTHGCDVTINTLFNFSTLFKMIYNIFNLQK